MPSAAAMFAAALPVPAGTPAGASGVQGVAAADAGLFSSKVAEATLTATEDLAPQTPARPLGRLSLGAIQPAVVVSEEAPPQPTDVTPTTPATFKSQQEPPTATLLSDEPESETKTIEPAPTAEASTLIPTPLGAPILLHQPQPASGAAPAEAFQPSAPPPALPTPPPAAGATPPIAPVPVPAQTVAADDTTPQATVTDTSASPPLTSDPSIAEFAPPESKSAPQPATGPATRPADAVQTSAPTLAAASAPTKAPADSIVTPAPDMVVESVATMAVNSAPKPVAEGSAPVEARPAQQRSAPPAATPDLQDRTTPAPPATAHPQPSAPASFTPQPSMAAAAPAAGDLNAAPGSRASAAPTLTQSSDMEVQAAAATSLPAPGPATRSDAPPAEPAADADTAEPAETHRDKAAPSADDLAAQDPSPPGPPLKPLRHDDLRPRASMAEEPPAAPRETNAAGDTASASDIPFAASPAAKAESPPQILPQTPPTTPTVIDAPTQALPVEAQASASADRDLGLSTLSRSTVETTAQIAAQIVRKLEGRSTRFDMVLTPEDLGRVDVSLEIGEDGQLAARLAFDNPAAAADLRGRADELRRQLQDAGFQVSNDSLSFSQRDPSAGGGFDRQQQRNSLFAGGSRLAAQADALPVPAPGAWINLSLTPDRVDVKV